VVTPWGWHKVVPPTELNRPLGHAAQLPSCTGVAAVIWEPVLQLVTVAREQEVWPLCPALKWPVGQALQWLSLSPSPGTRYCPSGQAVTRWAVQASWLFRGLKVPCGHATHVLACLSLPAVNPLPGGQADGVCTVQGSGPAAPLNLPGLQAAQLPSAV